MNKLPKSLTIEITNLSGQPVRVVSEGLSAGSWEDHPTPGTVVYDGSQKRFENGIAIAWFWSSDTYAQGSLVLSSDMGGTFTIEWRFSHSATGSASVKVSDLSDDIIVDSNLVNSGSHNPILIIRIIKK